MAEALPRTLQAFDHWHAQQPKRWEFIHGEPLMMTQPLNRHTLIKSSIGGALGNKLAGGPFCTLISGPEIKSRNFSAIPNVVAAQQPIDLDACHIDEPVVIVEVTAPRRERDLTGRKWRAYCMIPSLMHYLVVEQDKPFATLHTRVADFEWSERVFKEGTIELEAIGASLTFGEIYEGVEFEANAGEADA